MDTRSRALAAFEAALRQANFAGLRDLHEALQTGQLKAWGHGKAELTLGTWGVLGDSHCNEPSTACPLSALFMNDAHTFKGGIDLAAEIATVLMAREGVRASDFYRVWDAQQLRPSELRGLVEAHLASEEVAARWNRRDYDARLAKIARLVLANRRA